MRRSDEQALLHQHGLIGTPVLECLVSHFTLTVLNFLIFLMEGLWHFCFVLDFENYVADLVQGSY